jgi:general secretion pathway protein J
MLRKTTATGKSVLAARGFTLLEVMITLTILGMMLVILFSAFRLGLSAWQRGDSTREEYQRFRTASELMLRQVKSMVPIKIKTEKAEGDYLAFEGKPRSLKFVSTLPVKSRKLEGLVYAMYEFKEGGSEGGRLVLYEERALNKDFFEVGPKEDSGVTLLEEVTEVRFEYCRPADPDKNQEEKWEEEWNAKEEKALPKAVRVSITYKNEKKEKEEAPMTLLASIPAHQFEEIRTRAPGLGRRAVRQGIR